MRTLKLTLAYEGTAYVGWQRQPNGTSIQGSLEAALATIEGRPVVAVGAGRTDAGVHALGQVASIQLSHQISPEALVRAVNARFPTDIRLVSAEEVSATFHARFDATAKTYRYHLLHGAVTSPFARRYGWFVGASLDRDRMADAARLLVGERDFAAFQATGGATRTTVRTLFGLTIKCASPGPWSAGGDDDAAMTVIDARGSGFLRHMVRVLVGTLVEVGRGRRSCADVEDALRTGDRAMAGQTAPPHGLFLMNVEYANSNLDGAAPLTPRRPSWGP
jgi:tRNA pseudouridine38-40 synthase